jgi:hypothetical protein
MQNFRPILIPLKKFLKVIGKGYFKNVVENTVFYTFVTVHQSFLDKFLVNSFASFSTDLKAALKSTSIRTHTDF